MIKESNSHEKITLPPSTLLNPTPVVMVSCAGKNPELALERPNILTIGWVGTVCSEPPMVSISVRASRHSYPLICDTQEFVINLVNEELLKACDYCGVRSGEKEDKFAALSLTSVPAEGLSYAPAILEAPLSLACKVVSVTELGSHTMFVANIVSVTADMNLFDKEGKLCLEDSRLIAYSHGEYYSLGQILGFFGHSVASPEAYARRMKGRVIKEREIPENTEVLSEDKPEEAPEESARKDEYPKSDFKKSKYSVSGPRKPGFSKDSSKQTYAPKKPSFPKSDSRDSRDSRDSGGSRDSRPSGYSSSGPRKPSFPRSDSRDSRDSGDSRDSRPSSYSSSGPRKPSFPRSDSRDSRDSGDSRDSRPSGYSSSGPRKPGFSKPGFSKPGFSKPGFSKPGFSKPGYGKPGPKPGYRKSGPSSRDHGSSENS